MTQEAEKTLAKQALELLDQHGERTMLAFLLDNAQRDRTPAPVPGGTYPLTDGSQVVAKLSQGQMVYETGGNHTAPRTIRTSELPPVPGEPVTMLGWPNSRSVQEKIKELLTDMAQDMLRERAEENGQDGKKIPEAGPDDAPRLISTGELLTLAPGLDSLVRETVEGGGIPDDLMELLDERQQECAGQALAELPEEQLAALVEHVGRRLMEQD